MSHERSETIEMDGRFFNVFGGTRTPLPPRFSFERESYDTLEDAVDAARRRSAAQGPEADENDPGKIDDAELFLEMARLERTPATQISGAMAGAMAEAMAEAHQERGEAGEGETDKATEEQPGPHLYYDAQTGQIAEAMQAPDARRWYRLVEDGVAAIETFEQGEFPLIFDTQQTDEQFRAMPSGERDALMGQLHWQQYGRPGAPLLTPAEDLQQRMGWRSDVPPLDEDAEQDEEDRRQSSAVRRPAWLASTSATPVMPRLGGQPGLPIFTARPEPEPDPAAPDPLMEGLKEPLFPIPGAQRFIPRSVTDVEGLDRQLEPDRLRAGSWWPEAPKPNELLTPRDRDILNELDRQERMDLPAPTEMAGLVPLAEYLRRLTG